MIERIMKRLGFIPLKKCTQQISNEIKLTNTIDKLRNELFDWRKACFENEIYSPKELKEKLNVLKKTEKFMSVKTGNLKVIFDEQDETLIKKFFERSDIYIGIAAEEPNIVAIAFKQIIEPGYEKVFGHCLLHIPEKKGETLK